MGWESWRPVPGTCTPDKCCHRIGGCGNRRVHGNVSSRAGGRYISLQISSAEAGIAQGHPAGVDEVHRVVLDIAVPVQAAGLDNTAPHHVLLAEAVHLRLVEPGPEIDHTRGGVVVFPVVTKAGAGFPYLLTKGRVALGDNSLAGQYTAQSVPGIVVAHFRSYAAPAVVNILSSGFTRLGGDTLQAVGIVCLNKTGYLRECILFFPICVN